MSKQTNFLVSTTQIQLDKKQQMSLFLIVSKMRQLKLIGLTVDDSDPLEDVLDYGLTKTLEALNEIGQILKIDWKNSEEKTIKHN